MGVEIIEVKDKKQLKEFVKFPFELYKNSPYWVPPIISAEMKQLSAEGNPAFEHSQVQLFLAKQNGKTVGRIAALINELETKHIGEVHGRFGWFDFVEDQEVCNALLAAAEEYVKQLGAACLKGPHGFNQLDKTGMLTEGFDSLGTMGTLYNYPYYKDMVEAAGYNKDLEWVEIDLRLTGKIPERYARFADVAMNRMGLQIMTPHNKAELRKIANYLFDLMMETYAELPGFIPISDKQRDTYIEKYVRFLRMDLLVVIADKEGTPIGFGVTMPSMSKALQKARGKLFPFGLLHLLWGRRFNDTIELALIGVKEEWRSKGIHGLIFYETEKNTTKAGMLKVKINPMLEFNTKVLSLWKDYEHKVYKRRRTYRKVLTC
ncbi:MAG: hypothetical protein Kow0027_17430 [Saprospiraceae bacterium]